MLNFPDELIEHILAYVRLPSHLFQCLVASKRFNVITQRLLTDITFESLSQRKNFCQVVSKPSQLQLIKKLNFGLKPDPEKTESMYGGVWEHRIVNDVLLDVSKWCANIRVLDLSGCQMLESVFVESLSHFQGLEGLNVSYSSLKGSALVAVGETCGSSLKFLDISGLLRFRRIPSATVSELIFKCPSLTVLTAIHCPDLEEEVRLDIQQTTVIRLVWSQYPEGEE